MTTSSGLGGEWVLSPAVITVLKHDEDNPRYKRDSHRWKRDANNTVVYKGIKVIVESDGWRWAKYGRKPTESTVKHYYKVRRPDRRRPVYSDH